MKPYMTSQAKVGDVITSPDFAYCVAAYDIVWNNAKQRKVAIVQAKKLTVDGYKTKGHPVQFSAYHNRDGRTVEDIVETGSFDASRADAEFIVERTVMDGGGTGHGKHDVFPDGWHVYARRLGRERQYYPQAEQIQFYQSGCFNCVVPEVRVVGKMTQTFAGEK